VPGDVVRLSAGDLVPADARLLESRDLFILQGSKNRRAARRSPPSPMPRTWSSWAPPSSAERRAPWS
jgi:hypothetical protein